MRAGAAWELRLKRWHIQYGEQGLAHIVRCHPGATPVGDGRVVFSEEGPPDFQGTLRGGRTVCFDAKETRRNTFAFSSLPGHQAFDLEQTHLMGGLSFLAIRNSTLAVVVLWERIRNDYLLWARGVRLQPPKLPSIRLADHLPMTEDGWLPVILGAVGAAR